MESYCVLNVIVNAVYQVFFHSFAAVLFPKVAHLICSSFRKSLPHFKLLPVWSRQILFAKSYLVKGFFLVNYLKQLKSFRNCESFSRVEIQSSSITMNIGRQIVSHELRQLSLFNGIVNYLWCVDFPLIKVFKANSCLLVRFKLIWKPFLGIDDTSTMIFDKLFQIIVPLKLGDVET